MSATPSKPGPGPESSTWLNAPAGGVTLLVLFRLPAGLRLHRLGAGPLRRPDPLRVGLFVAALVQLWPIASAAAMRSSGSGPGSTSCTASVWRKRVRTGRSVLLAAAFPGAWYGNRAWPAFC